MAEILEERELSKAERSLTRWLLEHGQPEAASFLDQVDRVRVISRCACGCASIDFDHSGAGWRSPGGVNILSDHEWRDAEGRRFGVFVFSQSGYLAGLEVWSIDGSATPVGLPDPDWLRAIPQQAV